MLKPHERLYFLHIPKTAGSTLGNILDAQFEQEKIFRPKLIPELLSVPPEELIRYNLFRGHFGLHPHRLLPEKPVTITILRHPVEQVISQYYYFRVHVTRWLAAHPEVSVYPKAGIRRASETDLITFICDPESAKIKVDLHNCQCYWLTMDQSIETQPADNERRFQQAKQQLDDCAVFGLIEYFEESLELLFDTFGWEHPKTYKTINTTPNRPQRSEILPSLIKAIEERNTYDLMLYEHASKVFRERYKDYLNAKKFRVIFLDEPNLPLKAETLPNERVIEIPWVLQNLPQSGVILDVGSCDATYLATIPQNDRILHAIDPQDCAGRLPPRVIFHQESIIGNSLPDHYFDVVLVLSTLEHIGLPTYGQSGFPDGDRLTLAEVRRLLKPGCPALITVPVGQSRVTSWYRQYSPDDLRSLFEGWQTEIVYWGYDGRAFVEVTEADVWQYDYRDGWQKGAAASAIACIIAYPLSP